MSEFSDLAKATPSKLEDSKFRRELADSLQLDVDDGCVKLYDNDHRDHLGMSEIGDTCGRKLWYNFRWVKKEKFEGRVLRLFDRGTLEEVRFIKWLEEIGCTIHHTDENDKQYKVSNCQNHFGGSPDAFILLPPRYRIQEWILGEFKTWKADAKWKKLLIDGIYKTNPKHYVQMCSYGYHMQLRYCLYVAINKNTDHIYMEIVPLSWPIGEEMVRKAEEVINATPDRPPAKIAESISYFSCKWCHFKHICHEGDDVEKNCRSCRFSEAVEDGEWHCQVWKANIPKDTIPTGCDHYQPIQ